MAVTLGEALLIACLQRKDSKILSLVQKRWLDVSESRQYIFVMDYFRENGEMVGVKTFCDKFKLNVDDVDSRPAFYLNALKERFIFASISDKVPKILHSLKESPRDKLSELQNLVASLSVDSVETNDTLYSEDVESRRKDYEARIKSLGVTYLSMGCDAMDKLFYGYRKQDLITIGGKAGQGKSWFLVYLAYLLEAVISERSELTGETFGDILFITNEMGEEEIKERLDCIKFKLPFEEFLRGTLDAKCKSRYYKGLSTLGKKKSKLRIVYSCQTIDELTTLMGLYQPCAVFIDGSYLMEGKMQEGWEKIVYITRNLKRLAKNFRSPIINTTQLKRGTGKSGSKMALDGQDDFAYSSSYSQDSDVAMRMFQDPDMKFHDFIGCEVVKGRRVKSGTTIIFQNDLSRMVQSISIPIDETKEPERKDF